MAARPWMLIKLKSILFPTQHKQLRCCLRRQYPANRIDKSSDDNRLMLGTVRNPANVLFPRRLANVGAAVLPADLEVLVSFRARHRSEEGFSPIGACVA